MVVEYIREIDVAKWNKDQEKQNNIGHYKGKPGVWILLGKENEQEKAPLMCLQVGATKDIGGEIDKDIFRLKAENFAAISVDYVNQFGEYMFSYDKYPGRTERLYDEIAKKYQYLTFVCVACGNKLEDEALREDIEKYVAYRTLCPYWVNGRPFERMNEEQIKSRKEECEKECPVLFERIKAGYLDEAAESLKEFLDKIVKRKIEVS